MDDVTAHFMAPLQDYYPKSYLPDKKEYNPFKNPPTLSPFKEADFLKYLLKMGTKTKDIELYRRFIRTPNFVSWFRGKKKLGEQEIIRNYINSLDTRKVTPLINNKSEVEIIDLWMRGQERKSALVKKGELSPEMVIKFDAYLETLIARLPEEVRQNILLARNKNTKKTTPNSSPSENKDNTNNTEKTFLTLESMPNGVTLVEDQPQEIIASETGTNDLNGIDSVLDNDSLPLENGKDNESGLPQLHDKKI